ncbi:hypothetical protein Nepgr_031721 [Nepenthes gracilis]|uniref:Uncharacterized protein n=1 Tax=Nepenthes gracilis TaxID=150966 RepID=A0AAD3Y5D2_NEPGR|nr:hypothetical protein Nepgr_031721 [Nepenthes gracilis]
MTPTYADQKFAAPTALSLHEGDNACSLNDIFYQASDVLNGSHEQGRMPSTSPPIIKEDSSALMAVHSEPQPQVFAQKQIKEGSRAFSEGIEFDDRLAGTTGYIPSPNHEQALVAGERCWKLMQKLMQNRTFLNHKIV